MVNEAGPRLRDPKSCELTQPRTRLFYHPFINMVHRGGCGGERGREAYARPPAVPFCSLKGNFVITLEGEGVGSTIMQQATTQGVNSIGYFAHLKLGDLTQS